MKMLLLSDKEMNQINQILALEHLVKDDSIKELIAEDLKDEAWITDTRILITTCLKRVEKTLIVQKHLEECRNFIVYRFLEDKAKFCEIEVFRQIGGWNFNEIDKKGEKSKFVSAKFMRSFEQSLVNTLFEKEMGEGTVLKINSEWLHKRRELFFSEQIFEDLNTHLKKQLVKA